MVWRLCDIMIILACPLSHLEVFDPVCSCCSSLYAAMQDAPLPLLTQGDAEQYEKLVEAQSNCILQLQFITADTYADQCLHHEAQRAKDDLTVHLWTVCFACRACK